MQWQHFQFNLGYAFYAPSSYKDEDNTETYSELSSQVISQITHET